MILAVIGVALLAAVVTYLVLLVVRPPKRQAAVPPTTTSAVTTSSPSTSLPSGPALDAAALQRLTDELVPFIERTRQLEFIDPPRPVLEDDATFAKALKVDLDRTAPLMRRLTTPFKVLGLNANDADLVQAQRDFVGAKTVAFYDATTNQLHVRAVPGTTYVKAMIVVGLTRQLDDQHFELARMTASKALGDDIIGLRTLAEGDGLRVAYHWLKTQPASEQLGVQSEARARVGLAADPTKVPIALAGWLGLPSDVGVNYTQGLVTTTTSSPLDTAFRTPPDGSAQVVSIGRYQGGVAQLPVAIPKADGKAVTQGTFGQQFLDDTLLNVVPNRVRNLAINGYSGDALVAWKDGSRSCVRLDVSTGDSDPANMRAALTQWAAKRDGKVSMQPDAKRPGSQVIRLDVCDQAGGGTGTTTTTMAPAGPGTGSRGPTTTGSPY